MYNFKGIEKKWQEHWYNNKVFEAKDDFAKKKFYSLLEFPYPSGTGMHVGHIKAYMGLEVLSRKKRMEGYNVLFPIGFDAFGLPTENYAIKTGIHPRVATEQNIRTFIYQLMKVGFSFDWSRVINTTDPSYYKWTQWIFLKMFKKGLAFRDKTYVNYCPNCKVILSNEDSQGGKCDICHSDIVQKEKEVWYLRITEYADRLLEGLNELDFLPNIKLQQENWIGKSVGAYINFNLNVDETLKVYTTRPDTIYGVTFMVIAPEHPIIEKYRSSIVNIDEVDNYKELTKKKSEFERTQLTKDKTGVKIDGIYAKNPINNKDIPIFISDYVVMNYGTGAIMAVPAHDGRDYDFAKKFNIEIIPVIEGGNTLVSAYEEEGKMINSPLLDGIEEKQEAINKIIEYLKENNLGEKAIQYKMNDWAFNRQRYWGEPIPIIYCNSCGLVPVPYEELPLILPEITDFKMGENGESPLAAIPEFVNCKCPKCNSNAKRETDTMPQWAGSSWYYLRYVDPYNNNEFADKKKLKYWLPVDWYNGGMEHVTRHLIYSRFWHQFLYELDLVPTKEPYIKRTAQGMILGSDGEKMSKSKGNVVDPLNVVEEYGADTLRTYVLFIGDYSLDTPWNDDAIKGISRFLDRIYLLKDKIIKSDNCTDEVIVNKTIKKVSSDIETMKYNTAISELMKLSNIYLQQDTVTSKEYGILLKLLYPFAPHISEELNDIVLNRRPLYALKWPTYDESKILDDIYELIVQVNGKIRGKVEVGKDTPKEELESIAKEIDNVKKYIEDMEIVKLITVPGKLVNIVVR